MNVVDFLEARALRYRFKKVEELAFEEEPHRHKAIYTRLPVGKGDVPFLIFSEEVEKAHDAKEIVFMVCQSNSGKSFTLRVCPPKGIGGKIVSKSPCGEYDWEFAEIRLGTGPIVYREWRESQNYHHETDNGPIYVKRLKGKSWEEAYQTAKELIKSWRLPPIIFEEESKRHKRSFSSPEAKAHYEAFDKWFDSLSKKTPR